jgi:hypothetical protein
MNKSGESSRRLESTISLQISSSLQPTATDDRQNDPKIFLKNFLPQSVLNLFKSQCRTSCRTGCKTNKHFQKHFLSLLNGESHFPRWWREERARAQILREGSDVGVRVWEWVAERNGEIKCFIMGEFCTFPSSSSSSSLAVLFIFRFKYFLHQSRSFLCHANLFFVFVIY